MLDCFRFRKVRLRRTWAGTTAPRRSALNILLLILLLADRASSQSGDNTRSGDLTQVNIEDLMNMDVTSVSKREQKLAQTPAAIFVITQEDIRDSGATNLPDLLRMVPGMDVAQINNNTWAIATRGFNERFSNELQVMLDGRSVYTPSFGGVFWDVFNVPLEDVERIEVIRGPGGTVWGANAVNGVINVITKPASKTLGLAASVGAGNLEQGFATVQYGGRLKRTTDYRVYAKYENADHLPDLFGQNGGDGWHDAQAGFRFDTKRGDNDTFTQTGEIYRGREGQVTGLLSAPGGPFVVSPAQINLSGGFLQSVWEHTYSQRSEIVTQISFDRYKREDVFGESRNTIFLDFQHHLVIGRRHELVWGLDCWDSSSDSNRSFAVSVQPPDRNTDLFSGFLQDDITVIPDHLHFTIGTRVEHNYYTGLGALPSARLAWTPNNRQTFWAAISRAARVPSEIDTGIRVNAASFPGSAGLPVVVAIFGNPRFKDEGLTAYEVGYRSSPKHNLSLDLAVYYNSYDHQQTTEPFAPFFEPVPAPPHIVVPAMYQNLMRGETHGLEIFANWKPVSHWTASAGYAFEEIHMHSAAVSQDTESPLEVEGSTPRHSAQLRSRFDFQRGWSWNASVYFVDRLPSQAVPAYTRLDTNLEWRCSDTVSLTLNGQNLLRDHHLEFLDSTASSNSSLVKRSAYLKVSYRF